MELKCESAHSDSEPEPEHEREPEHEHEHEPETEHEPERTELEHMDALDATRPRKVTCYRTYWLQYNVTCIATNNIMANLFYDS